MGGGRFFEGGVYSKRYGMPECRFSFIMSMEEINSLTSGFLMLQEGRERDQWHEMGYWRHYKAENLMIYISAMADYPTKH